MIQLFNSGYSNNNMNIYISLIHLIENTFDSVYGENRFDFAFKNIKSNEEKENLYESLAKYIYPILNKEAKYILLSKTFELDDYLFRNNLLENTMLDKTSMMYWLYYANKKFKEIL